MITLGGDAELELVDSLDPFSEGVVFSVRPPKKSWKNIANLSGGEKVFFLVTLQHLLDITTLHHLNWYLLHVILTCLCNIDVSDTQFISTGFCPASL